MRTWLTAAEQEELAYWRHARRREAWLAGRWLLKRMLNRAHGGMNPDAGDDGWRTWEVLSSDGHGRGRAPRVLREGRACSCHVSLAHAGDVVWGAISHAAQVRVGIDVVADRPLSHGACELWFTRRERVRLCPSEGRLSPALWGGKEAVYKALNRGEPFVPAEFEVDRDCQGRWTWTHNGVSRGAGDWLDVEWAGGWIVATAAVAVETLPENSAHD
ncbi:MAG: 4'-phosphopantetheinyl transferase superfamily protein [Planctomycetaceae bacterium]